MREGTIDAQAFPLAGKQWKRCHSTLLLLNNKTSGIVKSLMIITFGIFKSLILITFVIK